MARNVGSDPGGVSASGGPLSNMYCIVDSGAYPTCQADSTFVHVNEPIRLDHLVEALNNAHARKEA